MTVIFFFFTNLQTIFQFQVDELENIQIFYFWPHCLYTFILHVFSNMKHLLSIYTGVKDIW